MYCTSLERIEQVMVMVPNFQLRRSSIVINIINRCNDVDAFIPISYPMWIGWYTKIWLKNALKNKKLFFKG